MHERKFKTQTPTHTHTPALTRTLAHTRVLGRIACLVIDSLTEFEFDFDFYFVAK